MPQVDFYVSEDPAPDARLRFACRLAEKVWLLGHRVYLLTDGNELSASLDDLLWTFRQDSFVPHGRLSGEDPPLSPILIGEGEPPPLFDGVLVNLSGDIPPFYERFERVAELVFGNDSQRAAGRERFRAYRHRGHEPVTHRI